MGDDDWFQKVAEEAEECYKQLPEWAKPIVVVPPKRRAEPEDD